MTVLETLDTSQHEEAHLLPCVPLQESKEAEKTQEKLTKWHLNVIHQALDLFDLPRGTGDDSKKVRGWEQHKCGTHIFICVPSKCRYHCAHFSAAA